MKYDENGADLSHMGLGAKSGFERLLLIFSMYFIEVYKVVLISAVWQSDSFFFICFSFMVYHRILNIVPFHSYFLNILSVYM